jgi:hypothetical protein
MASCSSASKPRRDAGEKKWGIVDEVKTLLPDIVILSTSHGPADTMFSRKIRVSASNVLVEHHLE